MKIVLLTALLNSNNPDIDIYTGTWTWKETKLNKRSGEQIIKAENHNFAKQLIIAADGSISITEDGKETCTGIISLTKTELADGSIQHSISGDCLNGSIYLEDGKLIHYEVLGCPTSWSKYSKVE